MKFATSNSLLILLARFVEVNNFQAHKIQIVLNNTFYEGMAPKHNSRLTQGWDKLPQKPGFWFLSKAHSAIFGKILSDIVSVEAKSSHSGVATTWPVPSCHLSRPRHQQI